MSHREELDLPYFCLSAIINATDNFATVNKIGQGGYGPVFKVIIQLHFILSITTTCNCQLLFIDILHCNFKGILEDGREVAVKCLSENSSQGNNEFMNEVKFIAKLQHRNLVRLIGYCADGENKMLIYEYMPNKSLDWHLFGMTLPKLQLYSCLSAYL